MNFIGLAAGKGSRMGNLGSYLQKSMYPVLEKPFLQYTLDALIDSTVFKRGDRIILVVGHCLEQIIGYFGTEYRGQRLDYVVQEEALGTGHAVKLGYAKGNPGEDAVVWHGDNYVSSQLFEEICSNPHKNCVTITRHVCQEDHKERVDRDEKTRTIPRVWRGTSDYIETCPWKFSAEIIQEMFSAKEDEFRALLNLQQMIDKGHTVGYIDNPDWVHLGGTEPTVPENIFACVKDIYEMRREKGSL